MSYYVAEVGSVKVKQELVEQFGLFYNGKYDKITDPILKSFVNTYHSGNWPKEGIREIRYWKHENNKEEWEGKYTTSFLKGIFTYGISYNSHNGLLQSYILDFFEDILPYITETTIDSDGWCES